MDPSEESTTRKYLMIILRIDSSLLKRHQHLKFCKRYSECCDVNFYWNIGSTKIG